MREELIIGSTIYVVLNEEYTPPKRALLDIQHNASLVDNEMVVCLIATVSLRVPLRMLVINYTTYCCDARAILILL